MAFESKHDVVVLYHKNCLDGIGSAWAAWKYYEGKVDLLAVQYGDKFEEIFGANFDKLTGKIVYCLDFSFDLPTTKHLMGICNPLVVLDHHDSAWKNLKSIAQETFGDSNELFHNGSFIESLVVVDQNHSGTRLSWAWFFGHDPRAVIPKGVLYVEDRDLWKWEFADSRNWTAGAFSYEFSVENFDKLISANVDDVVKEGIGISRHMEKSVNLLYKSSRRFQVDEFDVPIVNCNALFASDLGAKMAEGEAFSVTYHDGGNARHYSLRRAKGADIKLNEIAERFGGGGHPGAAAFRIPFDDEQFHRSHVEITSVGYAKRGDNWVQTPIYKKD